MDFGSLVGGVLGGLAGGSSSGNSQQVQNRDPWAAAQPWMTSNLGLGQNLQAQYAANPLSQYQQSAYQNAAGTNNQIRNMANTIIPQLSNIQGFDRTNPLAKPAGLNLSAAMGNTTGTTPISGNLGSTVNGQIPAAAQKALLQYGYFNQPNQSGGHTYGPSTMGSNLGFDVGPSLAMLGNLGQSPSLQMMNPALAAALGAISNDGAQNNNGYGQFSGTAGYADARDAAAQGLGVGNTGYHGSTTEGGNGMTGTSGNAGKSSDDSGVGGGDSSSGSYKGGVITANKLAGPNPPTPDDGYGALQKGEYVVKKSSVDKYGKKMLSDINAGRFQKKG